MELPAFQEGHPLHLCHHTMVHSDSCENRGNSFHHGWVMFNSVWGANMEYDSVLNYGGGDMPLQSEIWDMLLKIYPPMDHQALLVKEQG